MRIRRNIMLTVLLSLLSVAALVSCVQLQEASPPGDDSGVHFPLPTILTYTMPSDVVPPGTDAVPQDFYNFAWQEFVALNWPALQGQRGVPDPSQTIGQPGDVVWLTYKASQEVFLPKGTPPSPWNAPQTHTSTACPDNPKGLPVLEQTSKFSDNALKGTIEADGYTLIDRFGATVYFEMRMNEPEFTYIVSPTNQFYNKNNAAAAAKAGTIDFPAGVYADPNQVGAMELKATWRLLDPDRDKDILHRYYTIQVLIPGATQCVESTAGLVGLHVVHKTTSHPVWIWATFEQVDNTNPPAGGPPPSFIPPIAPPPTSTGGAERPAGASIDPLAAATNPSMQQLLASVPNSPWQYYQLIGTQWVLASAPPPNPSPPFLGNTTMETNNIITMTLNGTTFVASSCIDCHGGGQPPYYTTGAQKSGYDFSFMLEFEPQAP